VTVTLVQPYDPAWPSHFRQIEAYVASGLAGLGCVIEHVGSTSIPGMVAKPIIDVDVVIPSGSFEEVKRRLEVLGYVHEGDLGISGREAFGLVEGGSRVPLPQAREPLTQASERLPKHHLYVCVAGADELRRHLALRDFLRARPEWRERLSRHKLDLCVRYANDRGAYMAGKAEMVGEITRLALEAAQDGG
jgi:GrpB-like predicted nucleotidyltransferase (UPF0157 family)